MEALDKKFVDKSDPPAWTGMDAWAAVICFNTVEGERLGLPKPSSWRDLLDPVYKGHIVMPNPNSSGTGYLDVSSWLQLFGEEEGWAYMDALHENIGAYTHSGDRRGPDRLHRGRGRRSEEVRRALQPGSSRHHDQMGPGFDRHRHRQAAGGKG